MIRRILETMPASLFFAVAWGHLVFGYALLDTLCLGVLVGFAVILGRSEDTICFLVGALLVVGSGIAAIAFELLLVPTAVVWFVYGVACLSPKW